MKNRRLFRITTLLTAVFLVGGCGSGSSSGSGGSATPPSGIPGPSVHGMVLAGQTPVSGASIQLYAVGPSGYGSAGTALLSTAPSTDSGGNFALTGYRCATSSTLIYLVAQGGNPGLSSGTNNSALAFMAALGACGSVNSAEAISVNEVTTVASVWALAPFMSSGANVGVSSSNAAGLANAFATVNNLVNLATGQSPGSAVPMGATVPSSELNTLGNVLNHCAATSGSSGECAQLFAATTAGDNVPANTIDAALNIALNPGTNAGVLFGFAAASPVFQPALTAAPNDWTLAINYTGGGLNEPSALAVDQSGNIWVASYFHSVTEFSPQGALLSPSGDFTGGGLNESYGLAIDNHGNVWVANEQSSGSVNGGLGSLTELSSSGQVLSGSDGFGVGGINFPVAVASDSSGNIWTSNYGSSSASLLANSGSAISGASGFGNGQLNFPVAVAIDGSQNAWLANQGANTVTRISPDGSQVMPFTCCNAPSGLAIDRHGNIWISNFLGDSVSELSNSGCCHFQWLHGWRIISSPRNRCGWAGEYLGSELSWWLNLRTSGRRQRFTGHTLVTSHRIRPRGRFESAVRFGGGWQR